MYIHIYLFYANPCNHDPLFCCWSLFMAFNLAAYMHVFDIFTTLVYIFGKRKTIYKLHRVMWPSDIKWHEKWRRCVNSGFLHLKYSDIDRCELNREPATSSNIEVLFVWRTCAGKDFCRSYQPVEFQRRYGGIFTSSDIQILIYM